MQREWVTSDVRADFGNVTDLYEDSLGMIWMGIYGKGLAFYNGIHIERLHMPEEATYANQSPIFLPFKDKLYLNCASKILVFDP